MEFSYHKSSKIFLRTGWESGQVIPEGLAVPFMGYTAPHAQLEFYILRESRENVLPFLQQSSYPDLIRKLVTKSDEKGEFKIEWPALFDDAAAYYHLVLRLPEFAPAYNSLSDLLNDVSGAVLAIKYLRLGEVWLWLGTPVTLVHDPDSSTAYDPDWRHLPCPATWLDLSQPQLEKETERLRPVPLDLNDKQPDELPALIYSFVYQRFKEANYKPLTIITLTALDLNGMDLKTAPKLIEEFESSNELNLPFNRLLCQPGLRYLNNLKELQDDIAALREKWGKDLPAVLIGQQMTPAVLRAESCIGASLALYNCFLARLASLDEAGFFLPTYDLPLTYNNKMLNGCPDLPSDKVEQGRRLAVLAAALSLPKAMLPHSVSMPARLNTQFNRLTSVAAPQECANITETTAALANKLAKERFVCPYVTSISVLGSRIRLRFKLAAHERLANTDCLCSFYLAERAGSWRPAFAKLIGYDVVEIFHPEISAPASCAYAMADWDNAACLHSTSGLPALPFTTDVVTSTYPPMPWQNTAQLKPWLLRSLKPGTALGMPANLPLWKTRSGNTLTAIKLPAGSPLPLPYREVLHYAYALEYEIISPQYAAKPDHYKESPNFLPLLQLTNSAVPPLGSFAEYQVATCLVFNPDYRSKKLCMWNLSPQLVNISTGWQFLLWRINETECDFSAPTFSLLDPGDITKPLTGRLLLAGLDFWHNSILAERLGKAIQ